MNITNKYAAIGLISVMGIAGCSKGSAPSAENAAPSAPAAQSAMPSVSEPDVQPAPPAMSVAAEEPVVETEGDWVGVVVSTIDVPESKTMYIELDADGQRQWVASQAMELQAGDKVRVGAGAMEMENFASNSLGRTFDRLWLASEVEKVN